MFTGSEMQRREISACLELILSGSTVATRRRRINVDRSSLGSRRILESPDGNHLDDGLVVENVSSVRR